MSARFGALALACLFLCGAAAAEVPGKINYQGFLADPNGRPVNGNANIELGIWTDATSVDPNDELYNEVHLNTLVLDGVFSVILSEGDFKNGTFDAGLFSEPDRWLEVIVEGEVMTPRQKFLSTAYAMQATSASSVAFTAITGLPADLADGDDDTNAGTICTTGEFLDGDGVCQLIGDGDISAVNAGTGLTGGGTEGEVTISLDPNVGFQTRVTGICPPNFAMAIINANGTVICEEDSDTFFNIGAGLLLDANTNDLSIPLEGIDANQILDGSITDADISSSAAIDPSKIAGTVAVLSFTGGQSFDDGTLRINADTDRVGVGVVPDQTLDVGGNVETTGDYRFEPARQYRHFIHPEKYLAIDSDGNWEIRTLYRQIDNVAGIASITSYAPMNLPDGAVITEFSCYYYDNDINTNLTLSGTLRRRDHDEIINATMASVDVGTSDPFVTSIPLAITTTSITDATVDNASYAYVSRLDWLVSEGDLTAELRFYGCLVTYTLQQLSSP